MQYTRDDLRQLLSHHVDATTAADHPLADQSHPFYPVTDALTQIATQSGVHPSQLPDHFDAIYDPNHPLNGSPATKALMSAFPGIDQVPLGPSSSPASPAPEINNILKIPAPGTGGGSLAASLRGRMSRNPDSSGGGGFSAMGKALGGLRRGDV